MPPAATLAKRRRPRGDEAVSEIVGSVLLLGVGVAIAATFVLLLFKLPGPPPLSHATAQAYVLPTDNTRVVLEHRGGPAIPLSQLQAIMTVGASSTSYPLASSLGAAWSIADAAGAAKSASSSFSPGDHLTYTDATMPGKAVTATLVDLRGGAIIFGPASLQTADGTAPTLSSARATSTTKITLTFSEPLTSISAADFTLSSGTISSVVLLADGRTAEIVTTAFGTGAPPSVTAVSGAGTKDLQNNALAPSGAIVPADGVAPAITLAPAVSGVSTTSAAIDWTTGESGTSVVSYGPTPALGNTATGSSGSTHSVALSSLTPTTRYYWSVTTVDAAGNAVTQAGAPFDTASAAGGSGTGANYLDFSPATATLASGAISSAFTITLRDPSGVATLPASALTVVLATNSTAGFFLDATVPTTVLTSVTIPTSASSVTVKYVDYRSAAPSVLSATASGVSPGAARVTITGSTARALPLQLVITGAPASLDPGIRTTSAMTITLRDGNGVAVSPLTPLAVSLATNSSLGRPMDATYHPTATVTIPTSGSTVTFQYADNRSNGASLLTAFAPGVQPGTTIIPINPRGTVLPVNDTGVGSVRVRLNYGGDEGKTISSYIGMTILNPTAVSRTISRVTLDASANPPSAGMFTSPTSAASATASDAGYASCSWGSGNTITCSGLAITLPAYGMSQLVVQFTTNTGSASVSAIVVGSVTFTSPTAATVSSDPLTFRHSSGNSQSILLPDPGDNGRPASGFQGVSRLGTASNFWFIIDSRGNPGLTAHARIWFPAGWTAIKVPITAAQTSASLGNFAVSVKQPTSTEPGYVDLAYPLPSNAARDILIRATPPTIATTGGLDEIQVNYQVDAGMPTAVFYYGVAYT